MTDLNSKKGGKMMIASFQNSEQKLTKFLKLPETLAENALIPGNSRREFLGWPIPDCRVPQCALRSADCNSVVDVTCPI